MEADPMSPDLVVQNLVIIGAIALVVYYLTVRAKRRRALATYTLAYAFHAEAMANADADFLATFGAALPANATGTVLMRFSLLNRGKDKDIARDDFLTPVEIAFPSESIVRHANAVEKNGAADPAAVRTEISGNRVLVHPFDLPQRSSVIFNIVLDGSASPMDVSGRLKAQDAPEPLS